MACEIVIDTPGPYYSGAQIQGKVICTFNESKKIRGIKIRAYGDEHTEWWGTESYYNSTEKKYETRSVMYTGDNSLYSMESMLFGSHSGDTHLGPGRFAYPFSFHLTPNLPSTFENSYGYIRYTLKGIIDVPWGIDYEDKVHFVLISLIDLNSFPMESFQPTSRSDEKTICCWCCAGGEITVDINVNKTAFVPNESVKLFVALTNMSNVNIEGLEARLVQYITSNTHSPSHESKTDEITLAADTWSGVGAHGENKYDIEIPIPSDISVPNLDRSSLFEVTYDIIISASIPGCHSDIDLSFSVNLGHIQHHTQMGGAQPPVGYPTPQPAGNAYPHPSGGGNNPYSPGGTPNAPPSGGAPYPHAPPQGGAAYPHAPPPGGAPFPHAPPPGGAPYPHAPPPGGSPDPHTPFPSQIGAPYPSGPAGPYPSAQPAPYPAGGPGFAPQGPGASAPTAPAPYPSSTTNYAFAPAGGPSDKPVYPGGAPSAPDAAPAYPGGPSQMHPKEIEAAQSGAPSAPKPEPPPPSYDDILKKM